MDRSSIRWFGPWACTPSPRGLSLISCAARLLSGGHSGLPSAPSWRTIVRETVGKLLADKTPKEAAKLRVLDPACGSGSFLIGAYQHLLDWHLAWYSANEPEKWARGKHPPIIPASANNPPASSRGRDDRGEGPPTWRLTIAERKRILLNNIHGVDIDAAAVEVTKLSLLLKVLEGETEQTVQTMFDFHHERALPDLGENIKCGNSLIGSDFYRQQKLPEMDDEERLRLNVFDWSGPDGFPEIMKAGGFDAVIGNPPYVRMEAFKELKSYLREHYACHDERSDLYAYFVERAHQLLQQAGRFGMIVSNKFLRANYGLPLRNFLRTATHIERVTDFAGLPVFAGATVRTIVLTSIKAAGARSDITYAPPPSTEDFRSLAGGSKTVEEIAKSIQYSVRAASLAQSVWSFGETKRDALLERLRRDSVGLAEHCGGQICMGVKSGCTEAFIINPATRSSLVKKNRRAEEIIKPVLNGRDIRKYHITPADTYLIYTHHGIDMSPYPAILEYLKPWKSRLESRATKQPWYELQQPQFKFAPFMEAAKIIFPDIATVPRFALDDKGFYGTNTIYFIPKSDCYLLGLLNSALGKFYFTTVCAGLEGKNETYLRFFGQYLEGFPVHVLTKSDKDAHDQIVTLVDRMLTLHKQLAAAKTPHETTALERQIAATDAEIDRLVYQLYGLTEDEIRIVEGQA